MPDPEAVRSGSTSEVERPIPISLWDGRFRVCSLADPIVPVADKSLRAGRLGTGFIQIGAGLKNGPHSCVQPLSCTVAQVSGNCDAMSQVPGETGV